jgi:tetratricopeptide (TPR) repeat protein
MNPVDLLRHAIVLHKQGQLAEAEALYLQMLVLQPRQADAHHLLGLVYKNRGDLALAISSITTALTIDPAQPLFYNSLGACHLERNEFASAELACRKALEFNPDYADAHHNLGASLLGMDRNQEASQALERAIECDPSHALAWAGLGDLAFKEGRLEASLVRYEKALQINPFLTRVQLNRANCLGVLGRPSEALKIIESMSTAEPALAGDIWNSKSNMLGALGDLEAARAALDRGLAIDPSHLDLIYSRAHIAKVKADDFFFAHVQTLDPQLDRLHGKAHARLAYSMGKVYADVGQLQQAAHYYASGANAYRHATPYREEEDVRLAELARQEWSAAALRSVREQAPATDVPVFILGMPRSGTTLVEQILASHHQVCAAGELPWLGEAANRLLMQEMDKASGQAVLLTPAQEAAQYLARSAALPGYRDGLRITDKMPSNYRFLGLIDAMFPQGKIIHCRRSPLDTCLSNYQMLFTSGQQWSYDFGTLARYYRRYWELMEFWRREYPGRFLELRYEEMVANSEAMTRALLDWCGLPWDEGCLRFYESERVVNTASVVQVRQPIYRSSQGRWQQWKPYIQPLVEALADLETAYWAEVGVTVNWS